MSFHIIVPAYKETPETLNICQNTLTTLYPEAKLTMAIDNPTERRGKGKAIKSSLITDSANAYLDADLAVNPYNLTPMLTLLKLKGGLVVAKREPINRSLTRSASSKLYNSFVRLLFRTGVSDHQCGCKILSPEATVIAEKVKANGFFFDTELIIKCKKAGLAVTEYPVVWIEHKKKSTVHTFRDGARMFLNLLQLRLD